MTITNKKIIFSSGGTGGHIFPTLGIAEYFMKKGHQVKIVTDLRGSQYIKNNSQIKLFILNTDTPLNKMYFRKIYSYIKIFLSIIKSLFFLIREKPNLVFGLGGYVSFPLSISARMLNISLVIYENNVVLGKTNNFLLTFAKKVLIAPDEIYNCPTKYKNKIHLVGHILRKKITDHSLQKEKKRDDSFTIVVLGGSQGAEVFGKPIPLAVKKLKELGYGIKIFHQCIKSQKDSLIDFYNNNKIENNVFEFTDNILEYMLDSDIAITRCGASTTAELIYTQTPFIAVPYPHAMDNHQFHNAKYYENKGYCWMIEQTNFNDEVLFNLILKILKDKKKLDSIRENMKKKDIYNTNENIERAVEEFL